MPYSEDELLDATLKAYYDWSNIYHDIVILDISIMMKRFNMTELEVMTKIKEIRGEL